jgi:nitroreductase
VSESEKGFQPLDFRRIAPAEMLERARAFRVELSRRRSVRHFSPEPIPDGLLDECVAAAGSSPSGANLQPWTFVVVTDPEVKRRVRQAAEAEERENYERRMGEQWLEDLRPFWTDANKPFLEIAPALIAVFRHAFRRDAEGQRRTLYYTQESVGIATGMLIAALHHAGLATLTHTPSPMGFLERVLERPDNERAYLLIPVGYPAEGCEVPDIRRKSLGEIRVRV